MTEAEKVCNRIGMIHHGRLLAEGSLEELRAAYGEESLEDIFLKLTARPPQR